MASLKVRTALRRKVYLEKENNLYIHLKNTDWKKYYSGLNSNVTKLIQIFFSTNFPLLGRLSPATINSKAILLQVPVNIKGIDSQEVCVYRTASICIKEAQPKYLKAENSACKKSVGIIFI